MAIVNDATLKGYFVTGAIPTQTNFANLVDSKLSVQGGTVSGALALSSILTVTGATTLTDNLSVSGTITPTNGLQLGGATAANNLDDYEEGTFTPTVTASDNGTITVDSLSNTLAYTKVGNKVHIQGRIDVSAISSPTGSIGISLPFSCVDLTENAGRASSRPLVGNTTTGTTSEIFTALILEGTSTLRIYRDAGNTTTFSSTAAERLTSTSFFQINVSYIAS